MLEEKLERSVEQSAAALTAMADDLFDHPEVGLQEFHAFETLTGWLEKEGFTVERGIAGMDTAFRAVWKHGEGGPNIGLLCEYDALAGLGHACGHHMQGPAILGAAKALKDAAIDAPYTITVYGTPAEESISGKVVMLENGCTFEELDVALMMHGGPATQVDVKSLALNKLKIIYHGVCSHAALNCGGTAANVVPGYAEASMYVRSYNRTELDGVVARVRKVLQGAAMMTETEVEIIEEKSLDNKIPVLALNELVMEQAEKVHAPCIRPARQKTGSTDFGTVMRHVPGTCIRVAFVPEGAAAHSQEYLDAGKTEAAHNAVVYGAKILALTGARLIEDPEKLAAIKKEFHENLAKELNGQS